RVALFHGSALLSSSQKKKIQTKEMGLIPPWRRKKEGKNLTPWIKNLWWYQALCYTAIYKVLTIIRSYCPFVSKST
ncbi:MAG: hypothetical protein ACPL1K_03680, partial [Candidatus Kryptoniota bacterium]